jgi:hypothetical protein
MDEYDADNNELEKTNTHARKPSQNTKKLRANEEVNSY